MDIEAEKKTCAGWNKSEPEFTTDKDRHFLAFEKCSITCMTPSFPKIWQYLMMMKTTTLLPMSIVAAAVFCFVAFLNSATILSAADEKPLVVFLVRHAEKAELTRDPELSDAGHERAVELAKVLRDAKIEFVHSSDFIRTRDTAAPTAAMSKAEVEPYNHGDLEALVEKLRSRGGRHLVVGHSTTTPKMAALLGGEAGEAIEEHGEFDRLYIVTVDTDGKASTVLMRYGAAFVAEKTAK